MAVAPQDVIRIDVIGDFNGTNALVNSYQFKHTSGTSISDADFLTDLAALLRALYDAMKALWTALVIWRRIRAQNLTTGLLVGELDFSTPVTGTATGDQGAIQSAALVTLKTNVPRVVMRKYLPICENGVDGTSRLTSATVTVLNTFGTALLTPQTGLSGHTYVFGFKSPKTSNFEIPLTRATASVVATQRRRRPGVGS
jgi:hypothetical protein